MIQFCETLIHIFGNLKHYVEGVLIWWENLRVFTGLEQSELHVFLTVNANAEETALLSLNRIIRLVLGAKVLPRLCELGLLKHSC